MNELEKYIVIKELVDHGGNKKRAAIKLQLSIRQVNRLILVYKSKGKLGFIHGNRNRQPANTLSPLLANQIVTLYRDKYQGFNFSHFTEHLNEHENISVSYSAVYSLLTKNGIFPPKEHKATKRERAKRIARENKTATTEQEIEITADHIVSIENAHPRKSRAKYFGEEVQMDASIHLWFGSKKTALHLAIDNATGTILGAWFAPQETLNGYYHVLQQILTNHGIPNRFLTDNRTVFEYNSHKNKSDENDVLTQFGYACKQLGIGIETSSVSQYKGQIERANGTFQDRLVSELRLHQISTIEDANQYLLETFVPDFNKRFSLDISKFESVMEECPSAEKINLTLATLSTRKFDNGSSIKYYNEYYQAHDEFDMLVCFKPKTGCLVIKAFDGQLFVTVDDHIYSLKKLVSHRSVSEDFDSVQESKPATKKIYIPPMSHPWKASSFIAQQNRAHQYGIYAG